MAEIGTDIEKAADLLARGELVAVPTETVYGLAGNALDATTVAKIFSAKNRPQFDPLIVHVADKKKTKHLVKDIPEAGEKLAAHFWPGPLTLVLRKKDIIPDLVTAGMNTVGIRCPRHPLTLDLLNRLPFPLAAPSANPFGFTSPTQPEHVREQLAERVAYILDGGPCEVGVESTIIGFEDIPTIYRLGGVTVESIESVIGEVRLKTHSTSNPMSPGQLDSHYSPGRKLVVGNMEELIKSYGDSKVALLTFQKDYNGQNQFVLSSQGNLEEAARNLFLGLRTLGKLDVDIILAEELPEEGLGRAINDRLRRAAIKQNL